MIGHQLGVSLFGKIIKRTVGIKYGEAMLEKKAAINGIESGSYLFNFK